MKEVGRPRGTGQATSGTGIGSKCFFNQDVGQVKLVQQEETFKAPAGGRRKLRRELSDRRLSSNMCGKEPLPPLRV